MESRADAQAFYGSGEFTPVMADDAMTTDSWLTRRMETEHPEQGRLAAAQRARTGQTSRRHQ